MHVLIIHKNSVRTTKKIQYFTTTKFNRLTLFKEVIAVCSENRTELTVQNAELPVVEADGTCS
jgi:hypothetical protein